MELFKAAPIMNNSGLFDNTTWGLNPKEIDINNSVAEKAIRLIKFMMISSVKPQDNDLGGTGLSNFRSRRKPSIVCT